MNLVEIIKKRSIVIVRNYFLLFAINGLLGMLGLSAIAKLDLLIMLAATIIAFFYLSYQTNKLDTFIIFFIVSIAAIGLIQNYDKNLWYAGCRGQLYYMIFFFVGRYCGYKNIPILQKGVWPFLIVCIIGLILYVLSPPWYMNFKLQMFEDNLSDGRILEMARLSAFWEYPYWVSYGCAIIYTYLMMRSLIQGYMEKNKIFILLFIFLISLLTQQRAAIFTIAFVTVIYIIIGFFKRKKTGHVSLRVSTVYFLILTIFMAILFMSLVGEDMLTRLFEKLEVFENAATYVDDRANLFSDFKTKEITLLGDGIGRYSAAAYHLGKPAITDQQYMLTVYETGYWGCFGYILIGLIVIIKGLKSFALNYIELIIVLFFLLAMTGANCLSTFLQHIAIFWICCGRICSKQLAYKKKQNLLATY